MAAKKGSLTPVPTRKQGKTRSSLRLGRPDPFLGVAREGPTVISRYDQNPTGELNLVPTLGTSLAVPLEIISHNRRHQGGSLYKHPGGYFSKKHQGRQPGKRNVGVGTDEGLSGFDSKYFNFVNCKQKGTDSQSWRQVLRNGRPKPQQNKSGDNRDLPTYKKDDE